MGQYARCQSAAFESNEPSCSLPFSCVLPKEGLCADFAIATRMLCHRSALTLPSQCAVLGYAVWFSSLSAFSALQRQDAFTFLSLRSPLAGAFSFLLFGNLALPSIPHWFKFAVVCIPQTGILLLFGHHFGIFIPVGCVNPMWKHLFCPQKPQLGDEKRLQLQFLSPKSAFQSTSFFLKSGWRTLFEAFDVRKRVFHWCVSFLCYNRISPIVFFRHKVLSE